MDKRTALPKGTELNFKNDNGTVSFTIDSEIGRGASSIAYEACFILNSRQKKRVIIKECYPYQLALVRNADFSLSVSDVESESFESEKNLFRRSFEVENSLLEEIRTNSLINFINIFELNNTVYSVSEKIFGKSLSECKDYNLCDKVKLVLSTAKTIRKIHDAGYLYLDIKPDNIMALDETAEIVKLFDFDSLIPADEIQNSKLYRIAYTKGFSAPELVRGDRRKIGKASDVYGIGALLYFLIFQDVPTAEASEKDALFDFHFLIDEEGIYNQKLFRLLTEFFHRTLSNFIPDRFQDVSGAIALLEEIVRFSDKEKMFLNSFGLRGQEVLAGREKEITELSSFLTREDNDRHEEVNFLKTDYAPRMGAVCTGKGIGFEPNSKHTGGNAIFLTGPKYIGRSAIVRYFLSENREHFDNIIYVNYTGSILSMINDDSIFMINGIERTVNDSDEGYFSEKLRALSKILKDENDVLVLCNYDRFDENLNRIINLGWKVIITTEDSELAGGFEKIEVGPLEQDSSYALFCYYLSRDVLPGEVLPGEEEALYNLLSEIHGHPFAIILIAKSVKAKDISLHEALRLLQNDGFSNIAKEKISVSDEGFCKRDSVKNILYSLAYADDLDEETHLMLKFASLFKNGGIKIKDTMSLLHIKTRDAFNFLVERKWAFISNGRFFLEPFYLEMAGSLQWTKEEIEQINFIIDSVSDSVSKYDIYENPNDMNQEEYFIYLDFARSLINSFSTDEAFCSSEKFLHLLDATIINLPTEYDNFIIEKGTWRIKNTVLKNPSKEYEIFDKMIDAYLLKGDVDKAFETLDLMKEYLERHSHYNNGKRPNAVKQWKNFGFNKSVHRRKSFQAESLEWMMGYYFESRSSIYDFLVDGNYSEDSENFREFMSSMDNAIKYFSSSSEKQACISKARLTLSKANVMIRSGKYDDQKSLLSQMLHQAEKIIKSDALQYSLETLGLHMVTGWYYTYIVPDEDELDENILVAGEIADRIFPGRLIYLEQYAIPAANMYLEAGNPKAASSILYQSMDFCKSLIQSDSVVLMEYNILHYLCDVETDDANLEKINMEIKKFEDENRDVLDG